MSDATRCNDTSSAIYSHQLGALNFRSHTFYRPQDVLVQSIQVEEHILYAFLCDVPADVVELEESHHRQWSERLEDDI